MLLYLSFSQSNFPQLFSLTNDLCYLDWLVKQIFVLSAVSPEKMPLVLKNVRKVLKVSNNPTSISYVLEVF